MKAYVESTDENQEEYKVFKYTVRKYYKYSEYAEFDISNIAQDNGFVATSDSSYLDGYSFFQGGAFATNNDSSPKPTFTLLFNNPNAKYKLVSITNNLAKNGKGINNWDLYKNDVLIQNVTFSSASETIELAEPVVFEKGDVYKMVAKGYKSNGGTWVSFTTKNSFKVSEIKQVKENSDFDFCKDISTYKAIR